MLDSFTLSSRSLLSTSLKILRDKDYRLMMSPHCTYLNNRRNQLKPVRPATTPPVALSVRPASVGQTPWFCLNPWTGQTSSWPGQWHPPTNAGLLGLCPAAAPSQAYITSHAPVSHSRWPLTWIFGTDAWDIPAVTSCPLSTNRLLFPVINQPTLPFVMLINLANTLAYRFIVQVLPWHLFSLYSVISVPSNSGYHYYLVILDGYSHFLWTLSLCKKSDILSTLTMDGVSTRPTWAMAPAF